MTDDDVLYRFRLRLFALARELKNVRAACRAMGVHPSTYYRWKHQVDRGGLEMLRPRERRTPRMPNATSVLVAQRVIAFSLGHPGLGPARIASELKRPLWGGLRISPAGVYRVLRRHGLQTRAKRLGLVAGYACPPDPLPRDPEPERHLEVDHPGQIVQMDAFAIGKLSGTKGMVWQYTAIDVASSYVWAELHTSPRNPTAHWCSRLAEQVAQDLADRGWKLEVVMTDNASEFRSTEFERTLKNLGAQRRFIRAGRPQSNGCVERVQRTILEECWKPAFARYLIPKYTGLRHDLRRYISYYNHHRAHTGRLMQGRTPEEVLGKAKMWP
ncbi:MAG: DDE-type integrase/transposase/recombinase [Thermoleophilia bacterium]|nr:DDE-type integrase/transposase/recombinase [Thermoleophilia bacterium]